MEACICNPCSCEAGILGIHWPTNLVYLEKFQTNEKLLQKKKGESYLGSKTHGYPVVFTHIHHICTWRNIHTHTHTEGGRQTETHTPNKE